MIRSLRGVLLLETIIVSASIVLVSGVLVYFLVESVLLKQFDRSLLDNVLPIASAVQQEAEEVEFDSKDIDMHEFQRPEKPAYLQMWVVGTAGTFRSVSLGGADLPSIEGSLEAPGFQWLTLPDGREGRAIGFTYTPRVDGAKKKEKRAREAGIPWQPVSRAVTLVLARDTSSIRIPLTRIGMLLGCVSLSAMVISASVLWWIVRRSLRPLNRLAAQIGRLNGEDLSARLHTPDAPLEIQPVAERMNEFLHRLEAAFLRERSMSANLAHELRTPLSGIRSTIEVVLSRRRMTEQYEVALRQCLSIVCEMQSMVENLLLLARIEAGHTRGDPRCVRVEEHLQASWKVLESTSAARRLQVEWATVREAQVTTDPTLLDVVFRNVLENAVEYADPGGTVRIETAARSKGADVRVRNTGSTLCQEDAQRVFERFWRGGSARSDACVHCGVGLVLVKEIMLALGGSVEVRSSAGGWFEIALSIPDFQIPWRRTSTGSAAGWRHIPSR